jgi:hypothetical protein
MTNLKAGDITDAVRDVRCFYCGKRMYYSGEPKHEPELKITVQEWGESVSIIFMHTRCWNEWKKALPE